MTILHSHKFLRLRLLVTKLTTRVTSQALIRETIFLPIWFFFLIELCWFFIRGGEWCKQPRKVSYKRTFGAPDQGQMLDVWESQTTESALRWWMCHIAPHHTLEVVLDIILEHVLGIKTMTSLILDHVAIAYLYLGINTEEKVMILFVVIILELSQDWSWSIKHAPQFFLL